jgi:hypothetical protein
MNVRSPLIVVFLCSAGLGHAGNVDQDVRTQVIKNVTASRASRQASAFQGKDPGLIGKLRQRYHEARISRLIAIQQKRVDNPDNAPPLWHEKVPPAAVGAFPAMRANWVALKNGAEFAQYSKWMNRRDWKGAGARVAVLNAIVPKLEGIIAAPRITLTDGERATLLRLALTDLGIKFEGNDSRGTDRVWLGSKYTIDIQVRDGKMKVESGDD